MDWVHLFTSFEGRISRQPFWIAVAGFFAIEFALYYSISDDRALALADLVLLYPEFAVGAKRGHDRNTPMWVIAVFFALVVVFDLLLLSGWITFADLEQHTTLAVSIAIPIALYALVLIVDLGFRRGTHGPNRYGPDPLEVHA